MPGDLGGPAPAAVAPGQIPTRAIRQRRRHEVEPGGSEWMAATEPAERHPAAGPQTEAANRLITVIRAGRQMPAVEPAQPGKAVAVDLNESPAEAARPGREIVQNHVCRACRMIAVPRMLRRDRISVPLR